MGKARMLDTALVVVGGTEGGRSPTGVPPTTAAAAELAGPGTGNANPVPDPAVPEKPVRLTAEYKLHVLHEADGCTEPGQIGALLRREGLYSSHLNTWRQQRDNGMLAGLTPKRRGRKASPDAPLIAENERLRRENQRLTAQVRQAETIIEVHKKLSEILGIRLPPQCITGGSWETSRVRLLRGRMMSFYNERSQFDGQAVGVGRCGTPGGGFDAVASGRAGDGRGSTVRDLGADAVSLAG